MIPRLDRDLLAPLGGAVLLFGLLFGGGWLYETIMGTGSAERLVTVMLIDAIVVVGIQIYIGNTGILSFGHIGFGAIAGYTFAVLAISPAEKAKRIPDAPWGLADVDMSAAPALLIAVGVTLLVATVVGIGLARSGAESGAVAATVITLALLFVTHEVARNWPDLTGGDRAGLAFPIGGALSSRVPILAALFVSIAVALVFARSRSGRLAIAAREDNLAARSMGINPLVQQMAALLLSVAVVAVGSALKVWEDGSILPGDFFFEYTLFTLVMLIVGGRNSVTGAVLGVIVMTAGREVTRRLGQDGFEIFGLGLDEAPLDWVFRENLQTVFLGVAMLGFMIWRPKGLLDDWELDRWIHRRLVPGRDAPGPDDGAAAERRPITLEAADVEVRFGGFTALSGAGLQVSTDEVVGIIGPNGAGKTTFVNVLTGLVRPTSASMRLTGAVDVDLVGLAPHQLARSGLVRTFQNLRLFDALTVRENVEVASLVAASHRRDRPRRSVDALVAEAGLWEHRDRRARALDYGNSRRLELARAAALAPDFLLLDEPTSGMSDSESLAMVDQVRSMGDLVGAGIIVIDHDLAFITGISDRIYALAEGRMLAEGSPDEVQASQAVQEAYLGSRAGGRPARAAAPSATAVVADPNDKDETP